MNCGKNMDHKDSLKKTARFKNLYIFIYEMFVIGINRGIKYKHNLN